MAAAFDPYHIWLAIPPDEQPPNHYRLLGLPLLEDNPSVIEHAADQRMAHLRTFQAGKHAKLCEKLLNKVASARLCLLNLDKKAAYDRRLHPPADDPPADDRTATYDPGLGGKPEVRAAAKSAKPSASKQLGEYRLLEKLGEGGMGAVYKALHTKLGREVALKVLPKGRMDDPRAVARFEREMMAVGKLDHANVVRAFDAREIDGNCFLVMELIDGLDLAQVVRRDGPLPVADACEVIRQAALGLQSAHQHGLVHRDVKPSNLMLTHEGQVKLLDLGLARFQVDPPAGEEMTGTGQVMGTVDYMAPEQAFDTRSVDIRADIYSLGCTFFKLLTGQAPFSDLKHQSAFEKMRAHVQQPVPRIRKIRRDVPKELAAIISRMLAKDPAARYDTPAEVADAVGPIASGSDLPGLMAEAGSRPPVKPKPSRAMESTAGSASAGLTQFLRSLKRDPPRPEQQPAQPEARSWPKIAVIAGSGVAAVLLIAILVAVAIRSGTPPPADPVLAFDWPGDVRAEVKLLIDEKQMVFPRGAAPVQYSVQPGEHRIVATRPGYRPYEQVVTLEPGQHLAISPNWQPLPLPYLILVWPEDQRGDWKLDIDGRTYDTSKPTVQQTAQQIRLPLKPGPHTVWIARRGLEPFEQQVTIDDGKDTSIEIRFSDTTVAAEPVEPTTQEPDPAPSEAEEEELKRQQEEVLAQLEAAAKAQEEAARAAEADRLREEAYTEAMRPAEEKLAAWDFRGAVADLEKIRFEEQDLTARLAVRLDEVQRMAALKEKMIAKIPAELPPGNPLQISGAKPEVVKADESGLTVKSRGRDPELRAWHTLSETSRKELLRIGIDPKSPDDWLAGAILAQSCGDVELADKLLKQAQFLGIDINPYLASFARAALNQATQLAQDGKYREADAALTSLERKYKELPWFASNQNALVTARAEAKGGIAEIEAEELYEQATKLFEQEKFFDLRTVVEKLKTGYGTARPLVDKNRSPSFSEMDAAVSDLGKFVVVRLDGKGDFAGIQEAIDSVSANSLIEIQDNGPYYETILIDEQKTGLTLRGGKGYWPIIRSGGVLGTVGDLVTVYAAQTTLERLVIAHVDVAAGDYPSVIRITGSSRLRFVILSGVGRFVKSYFSPNCEIDTCIADGFHTEFSTPVTIVNFMQPYGNFGIMGAEKARLENLVVEAVDCESPCELRHCTVYGKTRFAGRGNVAIDSILASVSSEKPGDSFENCDVINGKFSEFAAKIKNCFSADPQFVSPKLLNYQLRPTSPCRGRASDGGDLGVRYTPGMVEILKKAFELQEQGLIKF